MDYTLRSPTRPSAPHWRHLRLQARRRDKNHINELTLLHNLLSEMEALITYRLSTDTFLYRPINLLTWLDPIDLPKIQSVLHHVHLDGLSRNKTGTIAGRGAVMTATTTSPYPSSMICRNFSKAGHCRSGCAVPVKTHGIHNRISALTDG